MKQAFLFAKAILSKKSIFCVLLLQALSSDSLLAQEDPHPGQQAGIPPIKTNWIGMADMGISQSGNICVVPYNFPTGPDEDEYYFYLRTLIFLADDNLAEYDPLYLYYNLPNGESGIAPITDELIPPLVYLGEITPAMREEFGETPDVGYCAMIIYAVCMPECTDFEGCGESSTQLLASNGPWKGYPIGNKEYPIGNGLFPSNIFQSDEFGLACHYTEYKEICCTMGTPPTNPVPDPCLGFGGTIQITPPPLEYLPANPSPCSVQGMGYVQNQGNGIGSIAGQALKHKDIGTDAALFPNPANNEVTIQYHGSSNGKIRFECMDVQGRVLTSIEKDSFQNGLTQEIIDVSSWLSGIYFIKVSTAETNHTLRFVRSAH